MRLLITLVVLGCALASPQAQIFVKQDAAGNNDGSSWEDAYSDLQVALEQSIAGDQLWIAAGTYKPDGPTPDSSHFVVDKAVALYGGFSGTESALDERDWETNPTTLSGDINGDDTSGDFETNREDNAHHLIMVHAREGISVIDGIIVEGGTTRLDEFDDSDFNQWVGGALFVRSEVAIRNCIITNNNGYIGAIISASMQDSTPYGLLLENCRIYSNSSFSANIRIDDLQSSVFNGCTFQNNKTTGIGGVMVIGNSNLTVEDCIFETNETQSWGGAIAIFQNTFTNVDSPFMHFTRSTFRGNSSGSSAGAIALQNFIPGTVVIIDSCEFIDNASAGSDGGALRVLVGASPYGTEPPDAFVSIKETKFHQNEARYGGAINFVNGDDDNRMVIEIDKCSFKYNVASSYAGAIASFGTVISITNSEFIDNIGTSSSGALDSGDDSLVIENCLFSGNFTKGDFVDYEGGGAILGWKATDLNVKNTVYSENISDAEGAAIFLTDDSQGRFENVLFNNHKGNSTILNRANLTLLNVTMVDNELAIAQQEQANAEIQNTIFKNDFFNYVGNSSQNIISKGGNISNDNTFADLLKGYGDYKDLHDTDPALDESYVPQGDSPCIDAGNPEGVTTDYDLAGEARMQGEGIDIGAFESPFTVAVRDIAWNVPELNVFPNPVQQNLQFQIEDDWTGILDISICDLLGRKVFGSKQSKTSGLQLFQEDVSHLTPGEYILLVSNTENTYASKVIVQN